MSKLELLKGRGFPGSIWMNFALSFSCSARLFAKLIAWLLMSTPMECFACSERARMMLPEPHPTSRRVSSVVGCASLLTKSIFLRCQNFWILFPV